MEQTERHLGYRRIDGYGVVGPIDMRIDSVVPQVGDGWVGGYIAVGVYSRSLNAAVPDVSVRVG